jgi:DNA-binding protein HU-beta
MKAEQAVDALFHSMKEALTRGERIELRGFGVFVVKPRKRGVGRNPRTGEEVAIPSGKTIRFKPGKELQAHGFETEPKTGTGENETPNMPDPTL